MPNEAKPHYFNRRNLREKKQTCHFVNGYLKINEKSFDDEDLSDDEKDELDNNLSDCYGLIDDMYSKFSEEEEDDDDDMPSYKTKWRMPSDDDM